MAFTILKSFYNTANEDGRTEINPFASIRQKSALQSKQRPKPSSVRKITDLQWQYVMETATQLADSNPEQHERSLFIITCMLGMYLRISDFVPRKDEIRDQDIVPVMSDFYRKDEQWWFKALGKGNVAGSIAVSDDVLSALNRWREHLGLTPLPTPSDISPLTSALRGNEPVRSTNQITNIAKELFNQAALRMASDGLTEESAELQVCSAHWMRHTGILRDIQFRPREHVRDDARHGSMQTTDKYIGSDSREGAETAKHKKVNKIA